jgi:hypothetical protein
MRAASKRASVEAAAVVPSNLVVVFVVVPVGGRRTASVHGERLAFEGFLLPPGKQSRQEISLARGGLVPGFVVVLVNRFAGGDLAGSGSVILQGRLALPGDFVDSK